MSRACDFLKNNEHYSEVPVDEDTIEGIKKSPDNEVAQFGFGVRHVQIIVISIAVFAMYVSISHIPVTIVAMTLKSEATHINNTADEAIKVSNVTMHANVTTRVIGHGKTVNFCSDCIYRTYDWSKSIQDVILMSTLISGSLFNIPMGIIAQKFGGKLCLQMALVANFITHTISPWLVLWGGWKMLLATNIIRGVFKCTLYPSTHSLLAKWAPVSERSRFSSYVYTGCEVGVVVAYQMSGLLAESECGWPCSFWVTGALNLVAFLILTAYGASSPSEHRLITNAEKLFIMGGPTDTGKTRKIPWKSILSSKPVWALLIGQMGCAVTFSFVITQIPTYVFNVLKFSVKNSGVISSLPHITKIITTILFGWLADFLMNKKILGLRAIRIMCTSIGEIGAAFCLATVSFISDPVWAVVLFVFSMGCYSAIYSGWMANYIDIAPNFAGVILGIGCTLITIDYFFVPALVSHFVTDVTDPYQWRQVLLLIAGVAFVFNAIYAVFMSADVQPWNSCGGSDEDKEGEESEENKSFMVNNEE